MPIYFNLAGILKLVDLVNHFSKDFIEGNEEQGPLNMVLF
jgi:hypothetical protein